jgi:hypothetical protein
MACNRDIFTLLHLTQLSNDGGVKRVAIQLETDYSTHQNSEQLQQDAATFQKPKLLLYTDHKKRELGIKSQRTRT